MFNSALNAMEIGLGWGAAVRAVLVLGLLLSYVQGKGVSGKGNPQNIKNNDTSKTKVTNENMTGRDVSRRCEKLTIPLCVNTNPSDNVTFPNAMGHQTQEEARQSLQGYKPLLKDAKCSLVLRPFICLALAPPCSRGRSVTCKGACVKAKMRCGPVMEREGISWPKTLTCDQLPKCEKSTETHAVPVPPPLTEAATTETPKTNDVPKKHTTAKANKRKYQESIEKNKDLGSKKKKVPTATLR